MIWNKYYHIIGQIYKIFNWVYYFIELDKNKIDTIEGISKLLSLEYLSIS